MWYKQLHGNIWYRMLPLSHFGSFVWQFRIFVPSGSCKCALNYKPFGRFGFGWDQVLSLLCLQQRRICSHNYSWFLHLFSCCFTCAINKNEKCVCNKNTAGTARPTPHFRAETPSPAASIPQVPTLASPTACMKPTPFQQIPAFSSKACHSSANCTVSGECCVAEYCLCKTVNTKVGEKCVGA